VGVGSSYLVHHVLDNDVSTLTILRLYPWFEVIENGLGVTDGSKVASP
jgi:hypothetical protein